MRCASLSFLINAKKKNDSLLKTSELFDVCKTKCRDKDKKIRIIAYEYVVEIGAERIQKRNITKDSTVSEELKEIIMFGIGSSESSIKKSSEKLRLFFFFVDFQDVDFLTKIIFHQLHNYLIALPVRRG